MRCTGHSIHSVLLFVFVRLFVLLFVCFVLACLFAFVVAVVVLVLCGRNEVTVDQVRRCGQLTRFSSKCFLWEQKNPPRNNETNEGHSAELVRKRVGTNR